MTMKTLGILAGVFVILYSQLGPPPSGPENWHQSEIIGQGVLTSAEAEDGRVILSLQLVKAESAPGHILYETLEFTLAISRLAVQNPGYNHARVQEFYTGEWYLLFRKANPPRYLLLAIPDGPPLYPVSAPIYGIQGVSGAIDNEDRKDAVSPSSRTTT